VSDDAAAHIPYAPLDTPKPFGEELWIVDGGEIAMGFGAFSFSFPTRMTIVRLPGRRLWIHSPIALSPELIERVTALGEVTWIVAPNTLHYWWLPDWAERFPEAALYAAPGLAKSAKRPLPAHHVLSDEPVPEWEGIIRQQVMHSRFFHEADFFHAPSRALILTDLIENFEESRITRWPVRLLAKLGGVIDPDGKAPLDMRMNFWGYRKAARRAVETMIGWEPERVILAHGRCYERDGAAELRRAFRWLVA